MSEIGVERGEVTMAPDDVLWAVNGTDPKNLGFTGRVVILPDETVWVDRVERGTLVGIVKNTREIGVEGYAPEIVHESTTVSWYRVWGKGRMRSSDED